MVSNTEGEDGVIGVSSYYFPNWKLAQRIIREDVYLPQYDTSIYAIGRDVILSRLDAHKRKRANFHPSMIEVLKWPQPLYASPGIYPVGYYVDIKEFYYCIYSKVTWDLFYRPSFGIGEGRVDMSDIWHLYRPNKLLRNSVIGMSRKTTLAKLKSGKVVIEGYYNRLLNPMLYCLISDIAHALAGEAVNRFGAVYYNTDGAVFLNEKSANQWRMVCAEHGFQTSIKGQGATLINGCASYSVGSLGKARKYCPSPYANIRPSETVLAYWRKYLHLAKKL